MPAKHPKRKSAKKKSVFARLNSRSIVAVGAVLLAAGVGAYLVFSSRAAINVATNAPAAPAVYLSPTSQVLKANETFTVEVRTNSGTTAVNAVQANFTYPVALLDYVPTAAEVTTRNPNGISFVGTIYTTAAEASVNTTSGQVKIARGTDGGKTTSGDQLVAKLTFRTKTTAGTAALSFTTGTALLSATTNLNILPAGGGLGNANYSIDTAGPTVSLTAPTAGANIERGATSTLSATASDTPSDIDRVEFLVDGAVVNSDTSSPYSFGWNTTSAAFGAHTVAARAFDKSGNATTTANVSVNVRDTTAPSVSVTAPTAGANVSGSVTVSANANDNTGGAGVSKVEFLVDGAVVNTDSQAPYSFSWNTTTVADGSRSLVARAYDAAATPNVASSAAVAVTVDNADRTPPTAPTSFRSTGNTYTSIALAWNASTDNVGVTGYKVLRNGTQVYSGSALTYNDTGLSNNTSYSYSVTAFDAAGNVSSATALTASTKNRIVGDVNLDDVVDIYDLTLLLGSWEKADSSCDFNKDGTVDIYDLSPLLTNWTLTP